MFIHNDIFFPQQKDNIVFLDPAFPITVSRQLFNSHYVFSYSHPPWWDIEDPGVTGNWDCFCSSRLLPRQEHGVPSRCLTRRNHWQTETSSVSSQVLRALPRLLLSWLREGKPVFVEKHRLGRTLQGRFLQMLYLRAFRLSRDTTQEFPVTLLRLDLPLRPLYPSVSRNKESVFATDR